MDFDQNNTVVTNDTDVTEARLRFLGSGIRYINNAVITGGSNPMFGSAVPMIELIGTGTTIVNAAGATLGSQPDSSPDIITIKGSDGVDTIENHGTMKGRINLGGGNDVFLTTSSTLAYAEIDLGDGDDLYISRDRDGPGNALGGGFFQTRGGAGFDTYVFQNNRADGFVPGDIPATGSVPWSSDLYGFERFEFRGSNLPTPIRIDYLGDVFEQIHVTGPGALTLRGGLVPDAAVTLDGGVLRLEGLTGRPQFVVASVTGSGAADTLDLATAKVTGVTDLGGGDDKLTITNASVLGAATRGGAGDDRLLLNIGGISFDMAAISGFETITAGYTTPGNITLSHLADAAVLEVATRRTIITDSDRPDTDIAIGSLDLEIGATAIVGDIVQPSPDSYLSSNPTLASAIVNKGRIAGNVMSRPSQDSFVNEGRIDGNVELGSGNDSFRQAGSTGGYVDLGSGNDTLTIDVLAAEPRPLVLGGAPGPAGLPREGLVVIGTGSLRNYFGGDGDDRLVFEGGSIVFDLVETFGLFGGFAGFETVIGSGFGDTLRGDALANTIAAGDGADAVDGRDGNDSLDGDGGNDTLAGGDGGDTIDGGSGDDSLAGDGGNDWLSGGDGNDTLAGGDGDDQFFGGAGVDTLIGGGGDDAYGVDSTDVVIEAAGGGNDYVAVDFSYYLPANIESLTLYYGAGALYGVGNELDNLLGGNDSDNLLIGGAGKDTIYGSDGNDAIFGETGGDYIYAGNGIDYAVGGDGDDTLDGEAQPDALYGLDGNDYLIGGSDFATDILVGGNGNDYLGGASGLGDYDLLYGNAGDDGYSVDTPSDLVFEQAGEGIDTVYAVIEGGGYYLYANIENLQLGGPTPFGVGNDLDNRLTAFQGRQWLLGGAGNDTLDAGLGNDVLFGESGADTFVFSPGSGGDVIGDFTPGSDRLILQRFGLNSFVDVQSRFVEVAGTTAINLGNGDFVVLNGVANSMLGAGDFLYG